MNWRRSSPSAMKNWYLNFLFSLKHRFSSCTADAWPMIAQHIIFHFMLQVQERKKKNYSRLTISSRITRTKQRVHFSTTAPNHKIIGIVVGLMIAVQLRAENSVNLLHLGDDCRPGVRARRQSPAVQRPRRRRTQQLCPTVRPLVRSLTIFFLWPTAHVVVTKPIWIWQSFNISILKIVFVL